MFALYNAMMFMIRALFEHKKHCDLNYNAMS